MRHIGLLIAAAAICLIPQFLINIIEFNTQNQRGALAWLTILVLNLIQTYLVIGQTRIAFRIVRGQPVELNELFSGGDKFLSVIGYTFLIMIPLFCGFMLLIIPGVFLILYFWPSYSLIIDYKTSVFDSFGVAYKIAEVNLLNTFVIGLASFGIAILGAMMCLIGIVPATGFVSVLWAATYLMMSGQITLRPVQ